MNEGEPARLREWYKNTLASYQRLFGEAPPHDIWPEPEERFANHKAGIKDAWVVKRHGLRLLPELYAHLNPMPFEAAAQMEKDLAEDLRRAGYTVTGGH